MTPCVFISYHTDTCSPLAESIAAMLEREGIRCWYAHRNQKSGNYTQAITYAIQDCSAFLLLMNDEACHSADIEQETQTAKDLNRTIIVFNACPAGQEPPQYKNRLHYNTCNLTCVGQKEATFDERFVKLREAVFEAVHMTSGVAVNAAPTYPAAPVAPSAAPAPAVQAGFVPNAPSASAEPEPYPNLRSFPLQKVAVMAGCAALALVCLMVGFNLVKALYSSDEAEAGAASTTAEASTSTEEPSGEDEGKAAEESSEEKASDEAEEASSEEGDEPSPTRVKSTSDDGSEADSAASEAGESSESDSQPHTQSQVQAQQYQPHTQPQQQAQSQPQAQPQPQPQAAEPAPSTSSSKSGSYFLPDSNSRHYSPEELSSYSDWDLYIARNEIFARHGYIFDSSDLREYFGAQPWYNPQYKPSEFNLAWLNTYEDANSKLMLSIEKDRGSEYVKPENQRNL